MVAAAKGKVHALLLLIDRGADLNAKNDLGQTALHLAALNGHAHVVKALIAEGAQVLDHYLLLLFVFKTIGVS